MKRRIWPFIQKRLVNPYIRRRAGDPGYRYALLETMGRRSGQRRQTPVGNGLKGDTFWIVTERGRDAAYVRNIEANPRVRVRADGSWRTGTAHLMPEDDPQKRVDLAYDPKTARELRRFGYALMTVRVDLDPPGSKVGDAARLR